MHTVRLNSEDEQSSVTSKSYQWSGLYCQIDFHKNENMKLTNDYITHFESAKQLRKIDEKGTFKIAFDIYS